MSDASTFFNFLPALAGGFLFSAIYTDDLNSKNLTTLIGFGMSKAKIVVSKLILMVLFGIIVFGLAPLFHCAVYSVMGCPVSPSMLSIIYTVSLKYLLMTLAFTTLSGIVVYGTQRTTFSFVMFILLAFGVISGLIMTALNTFSPALASFLITGITDKIINAIIGSGSLAVPVIEYIIYVVIAAALSALAFNKKEMEF